MVTKNLSKLITVLYVDDCKEMLVLVKHYLERYKHPKFKVDCVLTSKEFLRRSVFWKHDIYLVDYIVTPQDGLEILEELRKKENDTHFILLTGRSRTEEMKKTLSKYNANYVQKVLDFKNMICKIVRNIKIMVAGVKQ